jgi:hypothetical protein
VLGVVLLEEGIGTYLIGPKEIIAMSGYKCQLMLLSKEYAYFCCTLKSRCYKQFMHSSLSMIEKLSSDTTL